MKKAAKRPRRSSDRDAVKVALRYSLMLLSEAKRHYELGLTDKEREILHSAESAVLRGCLRIR